MPPASMRKARVVRAVGVTLVLAGFLPVLLLAARSLLPAAEASVLNVLPELPAAWVSSTEAWLGARRIHWAQGLLSTGLLAALLGLVVMLAGGWIARRQALALEAGRRRQEDAQRRARSYREVGEDGRIEPSFGDEPAATTTSEPEPTSP
jgi:hypothetical protein